MEVFLNMIIIRLNWQKVFRKKSSELSSTAVNTSLVDPSAHWHPPTHPPTLATTLTPPRSSLYHGQLTNTWSLDVGMKYLKRKISQINKAWLLYDQISSILICHSLVSAGTSPLLLVTAELLIPRPAKRKYENRRK